MTEDEQFDLYVRRVEELLATRLVQGRNLRTSFNMRAGRDQQLQFSTHTPDEDDLRSFLLTFRQFVSTGEPVHVYRIHNALWQQLTGDEVRKNLAGARTQYQHAMRVGNLGLIVNESHLSPERVLDLWINGRYFHNDARKARVIDALDPLAAVLSRHVFLDVLVDASKYVVFLANVIVVARREGLL